MVWWIVKKSWLPVACFCLGLFTRGYFPTIVEREIVKDVSEQTLLQLKNEYELRLSSIKVERRSKVTKRQDTYPSGRVITTETTTESATKQDTEKVHVEKAQENRDTDTHTSISSTSPVPPHDWKVTALVGMDSAGVFVSRRLLLDISLEAGVIIPKTLDQVTPFIGVGLEF